MRSWKMMTAGAAAMLISVGSARAVEQAEEATAPSTQQETSRDANADEQSDPAAMKADAGNGDPSGPVTRDELEKYSRALIDRIEREQNAQLAAPTFTDAG